MRGKRIDYKRLDDPYSDEETMSAEQITNLLEGNVVDAVHDIKHYKF